MNDLRVFENYLSTKCVLTINLARDEIVEFVNSFTALLDIYNAEIENLVKNTHATNSDRPSNGKILVPASTIFALKVLRFELENRARCGALPVLATPQALDAVQLNYMHVHWTKSVSDKANFASFRKLPDIKVPKLMADNYDIFTTELCSVIVRTIVMNGIPIDYLMRGITGNYDYPWTNR